MRSKPKNSIVYLTALALVTTASAYHATVNAQEPALPGQSAPAQNDEAFDFLPAPTASPLAIEEEALNFEKTPDELQQELREEAFDSALDGILPLRPNEIRRLLEHFDKTQVAVETPVKPTPKPQVAIETLSMDPGSQPTEIQVAKGFVTTLNIVDSTGAPWPIKDITWAGDFEIIEFSGEGAAHFIRITPQSEFSFGNMSIHLLALQTPIIITLKSSTDIVHYRFDAIIPEPGPLARAPIIESGLSLKAGSPDLTGFLEGLIPEGAVKMSVSGVDGRTSAYHYKGMTYLRTPLGLLSPAWVSSASSADGMRIYALNDAPVVLLSEKGQMVRARLSKREVAFP